MLILLSTVISLYLCQSQTHYQIHTTIQDHKLIYIASNLSTSSHADQYLVPDEIIYLYDRTTSYPKDSVVFKGSQFCICINFSTDYLKAP